VNNKINQYIS